MKTDYAKLTEQALLDCLPDLKCRERVLIESMKYSLEAGGKRVRPQLVFEFSRLCGGSDDQRNGNALIACRNEPCFAFGKDL